MSIDAKIFSILAKQNQQHVKRIVHNNQVGFTLGCKDSSSYKKQSIEYTTVTEYRIKKHIRISIDIEKACDKFSMLSC